MSVAGHVRPGETVLDLVREADEEIGRTVRPGAIEFLVTQRSERRCPGGAVDWDCQQRRNDALLIEDDLIEEGRAQTLASLEHVQRWWADRQRA